MTSFQIFKKKVIDYFKKNNPYLKISTIKKSLHFEEPIYPSIHENFSAFFQFRERLLELNVYDGEWMLIDVTDEKIKGYGTQCNLGRSIEECCDYIWKIKEGQ